MIGSDFAQGRVALQTLFAGVNAALGKTTFIGKIDRRGDFALEQNAFTPRTADLGNGNSRQQSLGIRVGRPGEQLFS